MAESKGRWLPVRQTDGVLPPTEWKCTSCGGIVDMEYTADDVGCRPAWHYCPYCGSHNAETDGYKEVFWKW